MTQSKHETQADLVTELEIRNRIAEVFLTVPDEEMYGEVLQIVLEALESKSGLFGYVDQEGDLIIPSLRRDAWDQCKVPSKDIVFPRVSWGGIWGRAMIEQETVLWNNPFELPEGHIPIRRALDVPIIHMGETIGNLLVGNKETDYDEADRRLLEGISSQIAPILSARFQRDRENTERTRAEAELRESETRFRTIFDLSQDGMLLIDPETKRFVTANRVFCQMLGRGEEEIAELGVMDIHPEDDLPYVMEQFERAARGEIVASPEIRILRNDGSVFVTDVSGCLMTLSGRPHLLGSFRDITERKRAEEALQQSVLQLLKAQEVARMGFLDWDLRTDAIQLSTQVVKMYGLDPDKAWVTPQFVEKICHPEDMDRVKEALELAIKGEKDYDIDHRVNRPAGEVLWVHAQADLERDEKGDPVRLLGTVVDITARKDAEKALRESEAKYRRVSDNSPAVLYQFLMTPDGAFSFPYMSDLVMAIMGIPPEDVMKDPSKLLGMVHPEDQEMFREGIMKSAESLESFPLTFRCLRDGEVIWIEARGMPTPLTDGGILWDGFLLDITARKRVEAELRTSRDRLRELGARLDEVREEERTILSRELHDEVGQALTALRMDLAMVENEIPAGLELLADRLRSMIDVTQDSIDQVNRMSAELRSPILDILGLEAAVESEVWEYQERRGMEIGLALELGNLEAAPKRDLTVYRVLKESLSNVRQHAQASRVEVSLRVAGDELVLEVLDDGIGITGDQLRNHRSFGLIGMQERVERLEGTLEIKRRPEGGTRIRASVPVAPESGWFRDPGNLSPTSNA